MRSYENSNFNAANHVGVGTLSAIFTAMQWNRAIKTVFVAPMAISFNVFWNSGIRAAIARKSINRNKPMAIAETPCGGNLGAN